MSYTAYPEDESYLISSHGCSDERSIDMRTWLERSYFSKTPQACSKGIEISMETVTRINYIIIRFRKQFESIGIDFDHKLFSENRKTSGIKTYTTSTKVQNSNTPESKTSCIFLTSAEECSLEKLSALTGQWNLFYKPIPCWVNHKNLDDNSRKHLNILK